MAGWSETVGKLSCFRCDDDQGDGKSSNEQETQNFNESSINPSRFILCCLDIKRMLDCLRTTGCKEAFVLS